MTTSNEQLPESVTNIKLDNKDIYLVGTAHVSKQSVVDVQTTVAMVHPDSICIELCESRYKSIIQRESWKKLDIFKVIKEKKALFLLTQLIMTSFYRKLGQQLGIEPGAEMIEGIKQSEKTGANLVLADRNIEITLKRVWGYLNFWNKMKMMTQILAGLLFSEKIDDDLIEQLKKQDQLETVLETFTKEFPEVKKRLIDERDVYLSEKIKNAPGNIVVAVVGAGHVPGIQTHIRNENSLDAITQLPPKSIVPEIIKWSIPAIIVALFVIGFFKGGMEQSIESVYIWVLVTGILSALGAAAAFAHPLTILSAFLAAPITTLHPLIAAGWVAGLVQVWIKKPTVEDFEDIPNAITSVKGFWKNPVSRVLLIVVFCNLGSSTGAFISGSWLAARAF
ncbi:MAG TPA: TraB/GumN family protein [bacterium]|nr:TraB/GumN family protein [bacterium]HPN43487.1 TraB/GumN family protein [bacterium]